MQIAHLTRPSSAALRLTRVTGLVLKRRKGENRLTKNLDSKVSCSELLGALLQEPKQYVLPHTPLSWPLLSGQVSLPTGPRNRLPGLRRLVLGPQQTVYPSASKACPSTQLCPP
jgi:hypothetical protein